MWGFTVRGSWRPNRNCNILTPLLWSSTLCLSRSSDAQQEPWVPLCWVLAFFISIFSGPQFIRASRGPLRPGVAFLTTSHSNAVRSSTPPARRTQLSYIIVRRPLDLWNRMFNRHQAEITVMQFRGHSLPVHLSISVPWKFFSTFHFIGQFPSTRFPLITAIRMCHLLPVLHLGMAFWAWSKGQNTTVYLFADAFRLQYFFWNAKVFYQNYFSMRNNYDR